MKKLFLAFALLLLTAVTLRAQQSAGAMPRLVKNGQSTQLMVDGRPYLILGGELGNSSASDMGYMKPIWPKLKKLNINTIYTPVYWELMEPAEGKFDFTLVEQSDQGCAGKQH